MKLKCIIDTQEFSSKPQGKDAGAITLRMTLDQIKEYSIEEVKEEILKGKTIRPSYCGGKEELWKSQQMFMIDIDNEGILTNDIILNDYVKLIDGKKTKVRYLVGSKQHRSYDDIINYCNKINLTPTFIYTSFNHKEEQHKYRLVFILNKEITNINIAKKIQLYLMNSIGDVDIQCKNLNRFYYGGKQIVFNSDNILDTDTILDLSNSINIDNIHIKKNNKVDTENSNKRVDNILININNSFNIMSTLSSEITPSTSQNNNDKYYNIKALRNRDVKYLRNKINNKPIEFDNDAEFWYYIYHNINMVELLELKHPKSFRCLFHEDFNPSASVYQKEDDGVWLYKCHSKCKMPNGNSLTLNNKQLIEKLGNFKSEYKAIKFIKDIYNLSIKETEWSIEQKANLDSIIYKLDMNIFSELCPQTNKNIRYVKELFSVMVHIAKDNVYGDNYANSDGDILFFVSLTDLAKQMNVSLNHINRISQRLSVLIYHDLVRKLDDDKIPEAMLKKAQAISIDKKFPKRVNFYAIPSWILEHLSNVEIQGVKWKSNGYTVKGASYEMYYRGEGLEVAQNIYPQHKKVREKEIDHETGEILEVIKDRTTSKVSNERVDNIVKSIDILINRKGYTTEKEIIIYLSREYMWEITEIQLRKMRGQLEKLGYKRIRANKDIKEQYNIDSLGYPSIIVNNVVCKGGE